MLSPYGGTSSAVTIRYAFAADAFRAAVACMLIRLPAFAFRCLRAISPLRYERHMLQLMLILLRYATFSALQMFSPLRRYFRARFYALRYAIALVSLIAAIDYTAAMLFECVASLSQHIR